jgi:hypothetical protein
MFKVTSASMLLAALACIALAQAPTGIITGTLTDESGAVMPSAIVTVTNKATGIARTLTTNTGGLYSAPALPAGDYEVKAEAAGFRTAIRDATVQAGETTTVNLPMTVGEARQVVTVEAASSQISYDSNTIQGVVQTDLIQNLPLNGRSFIQLAALEPGVTIANGSTAQFNALFTVNVLGSGLDTLYTMDGVSISDNVDTASGISSMNFPQDNVQEFQLSSANFDLATGITSGGAINVITRSGSNTLHGSAYFFYRDHNMAAYPGLKRPTDPTAFNTGCSVPTSPACHAAQNPFFARRNPGASLGGPLIKNKLFFFFNYEYLNQVQALPVVGNAPSLALLSGIYGSPYVGKQVSVRFDYHLNDKHTLFVRYSHDGNTGFGDVFSNGDPSNWVHNINWADQSVIGLTSVLTPAIVNDLRFQYQYWSNKNLQSLPSECQSPCVGGTLPAILTVLGTNFGFGNAAIGPNVNAPQARATRRYQLNDNISWQKGAHRFKFGGDLNKVRSAGLWGFCTPFCEGVYSPEELIGLGAAPLFPNLYGPGGVPKPITSDAGFLNLPFLSLPSGIFTGIAAGSVSTPAPYDRGQNEWQNQYHVYFQDTWKARSNLTFNYGLGWDAQTGWYNSDLPKPQFLAPIYGANNLAPTGNNLAEFSPAVGFAWSPGKSGKTVIRGGGGIYWDGTPGYYKLREPALIGPVGDGRSTLSSSAFTNTFAGIIALGVVNPNAPCPIPGVPCVPLPVGAPIPVGALTNMTLGQFQQIYNQQIGGILTRLTPPPPTSGPFTTSGIDISKSGVELFPPGHNPLPRSYQTSLGVQRDLGHDMVISADWARRQGENVALGEVDVNRYTNYVNGVIKPVIPACPTANFTPGVECSNGPITQWTYQGRAVYNGLLVKLNKRLSNRYQFQVSYALQRENSNEVQDANHILADYGPASSLPLHTLNIAGTVNLPWGFELSLNSAILSRDPFYAAVPGLDLPGTAFTGSTASEPLPGLPFDCLGVTCGKSELVKEVNNYNATIAGTKNANGSTAPYVVLPPNYNFGQPTFSQDFRLAKKFTYKEHYTLSIFGEVFNVFNVANLSGYGVSSLAANELLLDTKPTANAPNPQSFAFGQPTQRAFQSFGSAGPRAFQLGARFIF